MKCRYKYKKWNIKTSRKKKNKISLWTENKQKFIKWDVKINIKNYKIDYKKLRNCIFPKITFRE